MVVSSDREAFERFTGNQDLEVAVGLLAFAKYAQEKYEWERHITDRDGEAPSPVAVAQWIKDLPDARLAGIEREAIAFWDDAANSYMADRIAGERQAARDENIVLEVRSVRDRVDRATSFASTFWPNLFVGVVASFVFTLLIIAAGVVFERDPSPLALLRHLEAPAKP